MTFKQHSRCFNKLVLHMLLSVHTEQGIGAFSQILLSLFPDRYLKQEVTVYRTLYFSFPQISVAP